MKGPDSFRKCSTIGSIDISFEEFSKNFAFCKTFGFFEAFIALTLIYLALEVSEKHKYESTPWVVAFGFGLLHGLGFAGALNDIGINNDDLLFSLLFFNIGIEVGQLLVLPFFVLIVWLFNKVKITNFIYQFSSYLIGGIACFWLIERVTKIVI